MLFDMPTPGVTTKPILLIRAIRRYAKPFDNVKVPKTSVVGTVNRGWDVAKYVLQLERAMISGIGDRGVAGRSARSPPLGRRRRKGQAARSDVARRIAKFEVDEAAFAPAAERAFDLVKAGQSHPAFSSAMKYYGSELNKRRYEMLM